MRHEYRNHYESLQKRDFRAAIIRLLETDYKVLGSRKVLGMLANDLVELHREFYPELEGRAPGTVVWRTTDARCGKPSYGTRVEDVPVKTVYLPLVTDQDIAVRVARQYGKKRVQKQVERDVEVMARLVKSAYAQGGLLSHAELSALMNRSLGAVGDYLARYHATHDDILPTKGIMLDQGSRPTHKAIIIALYEQGYSEPAISKKTDHSLEAVGRYLRAYRNIKLLLERGLTTTELMRTTGLGRHVVLQYQTLVWNYHPDLKPTEKQTVAEDKPPSTTEHIKTNLPEYFPKRK